MERITKLMSILALGAVMTMVSCQREEPIVETPEETGVSKVTVTAGAGIMQTKSAVVITGSTRSLSFTTGDRLYVRGLITGTDPQKIVAGYLDIVGTPEEGATRADFSGDLDVYELESPSSYDFADAGNPLAECSNILGWLVHKDAVGFTVDAGRNGAYTTTIAATVNELMSHSLPVYGFYDEGSFPLSVGDSPSSCTPIFNVNLSGLTPATEYTLVYRNGNDASSIDVTKTLGTVTADGSGNAAFACYVSGTTTAEEYHGFLLANTADCCDVMRVDLATKALAGKVYNATRTAVSDPHLIPLTFEAREAGAEVSFHLPSNATAEGDVQYRLNCGEWTNYTSESAITLTNVGDKVQFRGKKDRYYVSSSDHGQFYCSASCYVYGNIMSLVTDYSSDPFAFATNLTLTSTDTFYGLFNSNTHIDNQETKSLLMPAMTLASSCYRYMFKGCTGLTTAPVLPAETLASTCYDHMFSGCTGLTTVPDLHATALAIRCCQYMFEGCTSLITAPALPATTLSNSCYENMFLNCTSLTISPILAAQTMVSDCYRDMFKGCSNLKYLTCLAKSGPSSSYFKFVTLFFGATGSSTVSASGTFIHAIGASWQTYPPDWTRMEDISTLIGNFTLSKSQIYTGTLAKNVQISIGDGSTVTLHNVSINADGAWTTGDHAGITCLGDATINLEGTNTVIGFAPGYPGIQAGPESKTLTIQGTGSLTASSNGDGVGIGSANNSTCGNITISVDLHVETSDEGRIWTLTPVAP